MKRRSFIKALIGIPAAALIPAIATPAPKPVAFEIRHPKPTGVFHEGRWFSYSGNRVSWTKIGDPTSFDVD